MQMGLFGNKNTAPVNNSGVDNATMMKIIRARAGNINSHSVKEFFDILDRYYSLGYRFDEQTRKALVYYVNEILKKIEPKLNSNPRLQTIVGNNVNNFYDKVAEMRWVKENRNPSGSDLHKCGSYLYDLLAA